MNERKVAFARRRQVRSRGSQMVRRGSLRGRETVVGDQRGDAPPPPPPPQNPHHPHLAPSVCPPSRSVCFLCPLAGRPVLLLLMDQRAGASPGCQLRVHSGVSGGGGELSSCLSSGGQMKSQLDLTAGMKAHIFSTDLHLTALSLPALRAKG